MSDLFQDDSSLAAALGRSGCRIRSLGTKHFSDEAGDWYLRGGFYFDTASTETCRIKVTDGTDYIYFDIAHDGTTTDLSSLNATASVAVVDAEIYWESETGTVANFCVDMNLAAPSPSWYLEIDPYVTAGVGGAGLVFQYLSLDAKF